MKQLPSIDTNADTFLSWITKTNQLITLANTEMVTANNSANGAITTGKGYVIGIFGANTLVCDTLSGGNTTANGVLTIVSNTVFSATGGCRVDAGITLGANSVVYEGGVRVQTTTTAQQAIDTFPKATYRTAKYVISMDNTTSFQTTELLCIHDGTNTYMTEYATITTGTKLCDFSTDINGANFRLLATPTVASLRVSIDRRLID